MRRREHILSELLVLRVQGGSAEAFRELVQLWQQRLVAYALTLLPGDHDAANDAVQDAWLAAMRGINRLNDPARFPGWIYRIVSNKCADDIRRRQSQRGAAEKLADETSSISPPPDPGAEEAEEEELSLLRVAMEAMPQKRRALLRLHYVDGLSTNEIAEALSIPRGTVKSRLYHAREELRKIVNRKRNLST